MIRSVIFLFFLFRFVVNLDHGWVAWWWFVIGFLTAPIVTDENWSGAAAWVEGVQPSGHEGGLIESGGRVEASRHVLWWLHDTESLAVPRRCHAWRRRRVEELLMSGCENRGLASGERRWSISRSEVKSSSHSRCVEPFRSFGDIDLFCRFIVISLLDNRHAVSFEAICRIFASFSIQNDFEAICTQLNSLSKDNSFWNTL